jgi:putative FmdB family regulatory protein
MPTYEYRCTRCGETFEKDESVREHEERKARCPKCGSAELSPMLSRFYAKTSKKS